MIVTAVIAGVVVFIVVLVAVCDGGDCANCLSVGLDDGIGGGQLLVLLVLAVVMVLLVVAAAEEERS